MRARASLIALTLAIVAMILVGRTLDWHAVVLAWSQLVWPWVALAATVNVFNSWMEALRWRTVLGASDVEVPTLTVFWAMLVGTVGNVVLPFKLGEAARAWAVARLSKAPMSTVASTVVLDRLMDVVGLVILLIVVPLIVGPIAGVRLPSPRALVIGLVVAFVVLTLMAVGWRAVRKRGARRGTSTSRIAPHIDQFMRGLNALRQHHILAQALAYAIGSWFTRVAVVWVMLLSFNLYWPVMRAAMTLLIINLSIAVVGTPGNVGTFELAASGGLRLFGATAEVAVSYAVALHLAEVVPTALLGAWAIWRFGLKLEKPTE